MKKLTDIALILCFAAALIAVPVLGAVQPDELITFTENRELQQLPDMEEFHPTLLTDELDTYVVDQFPFREELLALYSRLQVSLGKQMVRNLHVVDGEWLTSREYDWVPGEMEAYTEAVTDTVRGYPETQFCYMMVPYKTGALYRLAPAYIDNRYAERNREAVLSALSGMDNLLTVDIVSYFEQAFSVEQLKTMYYKTDFHWNGNGAQAAAEYLQTCLREEGLLSAQEQVTGADLRLTQLAGKYVGDLGRQLSYVVNPDEPVPAFYLADSASAEYFLSADRSNPVPREQIVAAKQQQDELSYNGIYTENIGCYRVHNPDAKTQKTVLILKDSFQNPTTDFMTALFSDLIVIDPRYYKEPYTFAELMQAETPDLVLFFYHQSNFSAELIGFLQPQP